MYKFQILKYYSAPKIQERMVEIAKNREVVGTFLDGGYSKRPDVLLYPRDVEEKVKNGIVAFHCSVEKWKNPLLLSAEMSEEKLTSLRKGWDLIIDIDAKAKIEHAKITCRIICEFLRDYGIAPTLKFSGRRGFHIAIAENAFPQKINFREVCEMYPHLLKAAGEFLREKIKDYLLDELVKFEGGVAALVKTVESVSELSPYAFVEIEKDWGVRHLFRMPFSLHNKTFLASIPLRVGEIERFSPEQAKPFSLPEKVFSTPFLKSKELEATDFLLEALEWYERHGKKEVEPVAKQVKAAQVPKRKPGKIPEEFFPPCIKKILSGLSDGRKRSIFTLATFLRNMGWSSEEIEKRIFEWNSRNSPPLRENYIRTQLKWHFRQERDILPANCRSDLFYTSIGVCSPDKICENVKNPVSYPFRLISLSKKKVHRRRKE